MNLDANPRSDYVTVDANLSPEGSEMIDLLNLAVSYEVEKKGDRHAVRVFLEGRKMAILRRRG
jgi:hypothetical protein